MQKWLVIRRQTISFYSSGNNCINYYGFCVYMKASVFLMRKSLTITNLSRFIEKRCQLKQSLWGCGEDNKFLTPLFTFMHLRPLTIKASLLFAIVQVFIVNIKTQATILLLKLNILKRHKFPRPTMVHVSRASWYISVNYVKYLQMPHQHVKIFVLPV